MTTDPPTSDYGRPSTSAAAAPPPPSTLANEDLPCAFWDALPTEGCDHPDLLAIEALKAESTPAEQAEVLKVRREGGMRACCRPSPLASKKIMNSGSHLLSNPTVPSQ